jgi:hypothetical protein
MDDFRGTFSKQWLDVLFPVGVTAAVVSLKSIQNVKEEPRTRKLR